MNKDRLSYSSLPKLNITAMIAVILENPVKLTPFIRSKVTPFVRCKVTPGFRRKLPPEI